MRAQAAAEEPRARPRIGLVLGAGGAVGASYLAGALEGIRRATGWEPRQADVVVGTSAGAFIGAITAAGIPPALMYARCTGEAPGDGLFDAELVELSARMDRHNEGAWYRRFRPVARLPRPLLSSPRLVQSACSGADRPRLVTLAAGLLPEGLLSTHSSIGAIVRTALPRGWPAQRLWVVACDLDAGQRVVFGRDAAQTDLHLAVSAATAIPGVFAPVVIGGRRHCDAGIFTPSNLDLLAGEALDAVLCINPLSGGEAAEAVHPEGLARRSLRRLGQLARRHFDAHLAREREHVERAGTRVFVLHPSPAEIARYPVNAMDLPSRPGIMRRAADAAQQLLAHDARYADLAGLLRAARGDASARLRAAH